MYPGSFNLLALECYAGTGIARRPGVVVAADAQPAELAFMPEDRQAEGRADPLGHDGPVRELGVQGGQLTLGHDDGDEFSFGQIGPDADHDGITGDHGLVTS
jgi:hypothetical protein